jgi:hypothetical protein
MEFVESLGRAVEILEALQPIFVRLAVVLLFSYVSGLTVTAGQRTLSTPASTDFHLYTMRMRA